MLRQNPEACLGQLHGFHKSLLSNGRTSVSFLRGRNLGFSWSLSFYSAYVHDEGRDQGLLENLPRRGLSPSGIADALGFQSLKTILVVLEVYNDLGCFKSLDGIVQIRRGREKNTVYTLH